jgi:hypothetical protein
MKKYIVLLLLLYSVFSLYAQSHSAAVCVLPVTGTGSTPEDNDFFYNKLASEVTFQGYILVQTLREAEFYLVGTVFPHINNADRPVNQYVFHLLLMDNKTNEINAEGELVYEDPQDLNTLFPVMVHTLLYTIPTDKGRDNWRNKFLYAGGSVFWSPRMYTAQNTSNNFANFGVGIFAEYHFLDFLAVGIGFEAAPDSVKRYSSDKNPHFNVLMEIPVFVKYVFKLGDSYVIEPYAGIHLNIPFNKVTSPPPVSWLAGIQCGMKVGPGVLFIDPRFSMDIGKSVLHADDKDIPFQRYSLHLGIGYKFGFFTRD